VKKLTCSICLFILFFAFGFVSYSQGNKKQDKQFYTAVVGFYNVENLFDTINDPLTIDEEYLPSGGNKWGTTRYLQKLENLSIVISQMGTELNPDGLAMLGLAEIENRGVIEDLIKTEKLKGRNYEIVHYDSPDRRGVDVGFIYQPKYFKVTNSKSVTLKVEGKPDFYTRDQLVISGILDGEPVHVIVAHWPSRRGGEKRSLPLRIAAAQLGRHIVDSLFEMDRNAKVIYMGDLNDDPNSPSIKKHLKTTSNINDTSGIELFNPMFDLHKKGIGTLAWKDSWNLFDQIMLSPDFMKKEYSSFRYYGAKVFNKPFVAQKEGNYKGYPLRTFAGGNYTAGYSDHFGVYILLVKERLE
jgi:hypothetical protein